MRWQSLHTLIEVRHEQIFRDELKASLASMGICFFSFFAWYETESCSFFSTCPQLIETQLRCNLYLSHHELSTLLEQGYSCFLLNELEQGPFAKIIQKQQVLFHRCGFHHRFIILRKEAQQIKAYQFALLDSNEHVFEFFSNKITLLKEFIFNFSLRLSHLLRQVEHDHACAQPVFNDYNFHQQERQSMMDFISCMPDKVELYHNNFPMLVSKQELKCVALMLTNLRLKEIGLMLGITDKTAGAHIANFKRKAGLSQKLALYRLFSDNGLMVACYYKALMSMVDQDER